jgi:hypothetical protein
LVDTVGFLLPVEFAPLIQDCLYLLAVDQVDTGIKRVVSAYIFVATFFAIGAVWTVLNRWEGRRQKRRMHDERKMGRSMHEGD